jgi:hypothetical protein
VEPLAHLILGALTEGALLVANSDDLGEMERTGDGLERLLRGLAVS